MYVEQNVLANFGTGETRGQVLMQALQPQVPVADLTQIWLNVIGCGIVDRLHSDLLSERERHRKNGRLLSCHRKGDAVKICSIPGKIPGRNPGKRTFFGGFFQEGHVVGKFPGNMPFCKVSL